MTTTSSPQLPESPSAPPDDSNAIEEERVPDYKPADYYPANIGDVFESRYKIVAKLGFGINSTAWLCRDLSSDEYSTLKIRTRSKQDPGQDTDNEMTVSAHLENAKMEHTGKRFVRTVQNSFEITSPEGNRHRCLLYPPLGMNLTEFRRLLPGRRFSAEIVQRDIQMLCITLDYLHKCSVVHTDISPNNILLGMNDISVLSQIEHAEIETPTGRKVLGDRTIYVSHPMPVTDGIPTLCDLGEARIGAPPHKGDIMPGPYRAPEVILGMDWDSKVDIWSTALTTWDLIEGSRLFSATKDGALDDEKHLAELVSLLGKPPVEFLKRSETCRKFWDSEGNWIGSVPIPEQSFETREESLDGEERALFLCFMRAALCWLPEERPTAEELAYDEFLMQFYLRRQEEKKKQE